MSFNPSTELKDEIVNFENEWKKNNDDTMINPYIIDNSQSIVDDFDFAVYKDLIPDPNGTALHVFSMFEQILEANGCADVHTSKDILDFYNILDDISKLLITTVGGLRTFLSKCNRFSFDEKNRNVVYLTSQESFYKLCRDTEYTNNDMCSPPLCDDPLFVDKLDSKQTSIDSPGFMNPQAEPFVPIIDEPSLSTNQQNDKSEKIIEKTSSRINIIEKDKGECCMNYMLHDNAKNIKRTDSKQSSESCSNNKCKKEKSKPDENGSKESAKQDAPKKEKSSKSRSSSFLDECEAEIVEINKTTYPKKGSGFSLSETIDIGVIQDSKREDVNMTVFENTTNNCKVCIVTEKGYYHPNLDNFKRVFSGEPAIEDKVEKKEKKKECPQKIKNVKVEVSSSSSNPKITKEKQSIPKEKPTKLVSENPTEKAKKVLEINAVTKNETTSKKICDRKEPPLCVVEVGIQTDLSKQERNELMGKCENLRTLNTKLMSDLKLSQQTAQQKHEELLDELQKQKNKFSTMHDKFQNENSEQRRAIDKLRKESMRNQQSNESEMKKLSNERKELNTSIKNMQKRCDEIVAKEEEYKRVLVERNAEIDGLAQLNTDMRKKHEVEKHELEEIMQRLTCSQTHQSQRAQKVEIALLEVKKDGVTNKYREQATIIQNTINQMQYWPQVPEAQNIRSIWEDYKKHFQNTYEKMQEEFIILIQAVKDGQPLERMPPARYADPPPYPKTPTFNMPQQNMPPQSMPSQNMPPHIQAQRMQMILAAQQRNRGNVSPQTQLPNPIQQHSPPAEHPDQAPAVASVMAKSDIVNDEAESDSIATASGYSSDSEESESSSNKSDSDKLELLAQKKLDRVVMRLGSLFPNYSRDQLQYFAAEYRRRQGSLSGMKFEKIVTDIERSIRTIRAPQKTPKVKQQVASPIKQVPLRPVVDVNKMKKAMKPPAVQAVNPNTSASFKRTRANHSLADVAHAGKQGSWLEHPAVRSGANVFGHEEGCIICFEDMTRSTALKLHCGHIFHRDCISCWLNEQRTCPICRVHALLPEEYPALG